jgi:uncharacterized oxidoreductase
MRINNNVILITGGSSGIGNALVHALLQKENQVIICGRHKPENLEYSTNIRYIACDLRKTSDIIAVFEKLKEENIYVNILINNAGIIDDESFLTQELDYTELQHILSVNLLAPIILSDLFLKQVDLDSEACIINIGSNTAFTPDTSFITYSASKAGLHSFSICLREKLKLSQIKVFEMIPPRVDTTMTRNVSKNKEHIDTIEMITSEDCAESILEALQSDIYEFKIPLY